MKYTIKNLKTALSLASVDFLPEIEKQSIFLNKDLQEAAVVILNAPVEDKYKLKVLYDSKLRSEALLILNSFLKTKMIQRAFKNPDFWYNAVLLLKSGLREKTQTRILFDSRLRKYTKYLVVSDLATIEARAAIGLKDINEVIKHLLMQDPSGRTRGCGCALCDYKNQEFKNHKYLSSYRKEAKNLDRIDQIFETSDTSKPMSLVDPFECQLFDNFNTVFIKSNKGTEKMSSPLGKKKKTYIKKVIKLRGSEGRKAVLDRVSRNREHIHDLIQIKFGIDSNIKDTRKQLKQLVLLPL